MATAFPERENDMSKSTRRRLMVHGADASHGLVGSGAESLTVFDMRTVESHTRLPNRTCFTASHVYRYMYVYDVYVYMYV